MRKEIITLRKYSAKRGFTLTEMLLVVALIAVVSGLGGGIYVGTYKKLLVDKAARDFMLTAKYARIMAIEKQQPYQIQIDVENGRFELVTSEFDEDTGKTQQTIVRDYYCKPVEFEDEISFEDIKADGGGLSIANQTDSEQRQRISFYPDGSAESAMVQIGNGKTHYSIAIYASTGRVTIFEGTLEDVDIGVVDLDAEQ